MSRCFPYPPPAYHVSPIESFKLQKEIELVKEKEKKRHRKEKREKKQKKTDDAEHKHKKRKREQKNLLEQKIDNCTKNTYAKAEVLERSGLTEEHDLPCNVQNYESSESSHDSKKRKIVPSSVTLTTNGTKLCIKLSMPKQQDHDQQSSMRMENKVSGPRKVVLKPSSSVITEPKYSEPRRNLLISQSSARLQQKGTEMSKINLQAQPLARLKNNDLTSSRVMVKDHDQQSLVRMKNKVSGLSKVVLKPSSSVTTEPKYAEPRSLLISQSSARLQQKSSEMSSINLQEQPLVRLKNNDLAPSQVVVKDRELQSFSRMGNKISGQSNIASKPSSSVRTEPKHSVPRRILLCSQSSKQKGSQISSINLETQHLVRLENTDLTPSHVVAKPKEVMISKSDEPCFSGRRTCNGREADKTASCSKPGSSQNGTKGTDQSTNIILNYNFPPLEFMSCDSGDEQWLFGAPKQSACLAANSKVSVDGLSSTIVGSEESLQPRACYIPEFEMYQLPYVIPF